MIRITQIVLAILVVTLLATDGADISDDSFFVIILIFGIPHGSLDYGIFKDTKRNASKRQFLAKYVLFILGYLLIWLFNPFHGLLLFIALSIYHFGQEHFEELGLDDVGLSHVLAYGAFVLFLPFFFQYEELGSYVQLITSVQLPFLSEIIRYAINGFVIIVNLILSFNLYRNRTFNGRQSTERLIILAALGAMFFLLPLVQSFAIYFIIFHSVNAMKHQFQWMKKNKSDYSILKYIRELAPFSVLAYLGGAGFLWLMKGADLTNQGVYLLVFISLLTLPHMLVFDSFYSEAKKI